MAINRGPGGSGDATTDSNSQATAAINAAAAAEAYKIAAGVSADSAASSAASAGNAADTALAAITTDTTTLAAGSSATSSYNNVTKVLSLGVPQGIQGIQGLTGVGVVAGGTVGQLLTKASSTDYDMTWTTVSGTGTVTSVSMTVPTGLSITGSPITTSGTLALDFSTGYSIPTNTNQSYWSTAYGWGNHASAGYLTTSTAASTYQPLDADLTAIAGLAGATGLLKKTSANTWTLDTATYLLSSDIGTSVQAYDADLTSWASKTAPSGVAVGTTDTQTLTNKRITLRVSTTTSSATPTINTDNVDMYGLTAQTVDITSFTTNLSGTPTDGQKLWIYIVGTAARAITWGASFESSTATLPTTTVTTNRLDVGFVWNTATSKWRCVAVA